MVSYSNLIKLVMPFLIIGCSSNSGRKDMILQEMIKGLEASNIRIQRSTEGFLHDLNNKLSDPASAERARIWEPNAKAIYVLSKELFNYIAELKNEFKKGLSVNSIMITKKGGEVLYERIKAYSQGLFSIDSSFKMEFENSIVFLSEDFDLGKKNETFTEHFFGSNSQNEALAWLSKFQNNIKVCENKLIAYCNNKVASFEPFYTMYSAIIGQSSNIVKPGHKVKITAGVGIFSKIAMPEILISGRKIEVDEKGTAILDIRASTKPGKYRVPVVINFTDENGFKQEIKETIEYTVSDCGN